MLLIANEQRGWGGGGAPGGLFYDRRDLDFRFLEGEGGVFVCCSALSFSIIDSIFLATRMNWKQQVTEGKVG